MPTQVRRFVHATCLLIIAALLVACSPKAIPMSPEEIQRTESLMASVSTRCVGRYLIELPAAFVLNSESTTKIDGVSVSVHPMEESIFNAKRELRLADLARTKFVGAESSLPFVRSITPLEKPLIGVFIDRARNVHEGRLGRTLEILGWRDGFTINATVEATDNSFPEDAGDPISQKIGSDVSEKRSALFNVFLRVSGRADSDVPDKPGLCIPNGFVSGAERANQETDFVYHMAGAPDVWFGFESSDEIREDNSLLQRASQLEGAMAEVGAKVLRKGRRDVHGQEFEELLFVNTQEQFKVRGVHFRMNGNELRKVPEQPFLGVHFHNGKRIPRPEMTMAQKDDLKLNEPLVKATLSDAEALAIWDRVTSTLRSRPGAY